MRRECQTKFLEKDVDEELVLGFSALFFGLSFLERRSKRFGREVRSRRGERSRVLWVSSGTFGVGERRERASWRLGGESREIKVVQFRL
jgi:hypothetical protein